MGSSIRYSFDRPLTFSEMTEIRLAIADRSGAGALSTFYLIATDDELDVSRLDPTKFRLPKAQFAEIRRWLLEEEMARTGKVTPDPVCRWNTYGPWESQ